MHTVGPDDGIAMDVDHTIPAGCPHTADIFPFIEQVRRRTWLKDIDVLKPADMVEKQLIEDLSREDKTIVPEPVYHRYAASHDCPIGGRNKDSIYSERTAVFDLFGNPNAIQNRQSSGGYPIAAHFIPGEFAFIEKQNPSTCLSGKKRRAATGRTGANHDDIISRLVCGLGNFHASLSDFADPNKKAERADFAIIGIKNDDIAFSV